MNPSDAPKTVEEIAASGLIEKLARVGYISCGFIYIVIGILAAKLTWGERGDLADPPSAIQIMNNEPLGRLLVPFIAVGLAAYAVWRFVQAIADPDDQGRTFKGLIVRSGRVASGLGYSLLAVSAGNIAAGMLMANDQHDTFVWQVFSEPPGMLLGALGAVILLCVAIDETRKACTTNFGERFERNKMHTAEWLGTICTGSWGCAARAVILLFAGAYLAQAVFEADPGRIRGFEAILASMFGLPYGHLLLRFVALGLVAYGVFMAQAGLRRKHPF